jgi:hypothetical protein
MLQAQLPGNFDTLLETGFTGTSRADYRGLHVLGSQYWLDAEFKTTPVEVEEQSLPMSRFLCAMLFALLLVGCATTRSTHWKPPMCRRCMAAMRRIAILCSNMA